jgi:hypothetical protein
VCRDMGTLVLVMALKWAAIALLPGSATAQQTQTSPQTPPQTQSQTPAKPPPAAEAPRPPKSSQRACSTRCHDSSSSAAAGAAWQVTRRDGNGTKICETEHS